MGQAELFPSNFQGLWYGILQEDWIYGHSSQCLCKAVPKYHTELPTVQTNGEGGGQIINDKRSHNTLKTALASQRFVVFFLIFCLPPVGLGNCAV